MEQGRGASLEEQTGAGNCCAGGGRRAAVQAMGQMLKECLVLKHRSASHHDPSNSKDGKINFKANSSTGSLGAAEQPLMQSHYQ